MDRSEAATRLLEWQLEGAGDPRGLAGGDGQSLVAIVESLASERTVRPRLARPPPPSADLRLDEEREIAGLLRHLAVLTPVLSSDERASLEARLRVGLLPSGRLARIRQDLERFALRQVRKAVQEDFEAQNFPGEQTAAEAPPRTVLLFSRNGQLLAGEGSGSSQDLGALSQLVARGEAGSTLHVAHGEGHVVCHIGHRAALVAVFAGRPQANTGGALRVSLQSLEQREPLVSALHQPSSHEALTAFVRAVRALLQKNS